MFSKNKNKILYVSVAIIVVVVAALSVWFLRSPEPKSDKISPYKTVQVGEAKIKAELVTTEADQVRGLSGRKSLAPNSGMLFVFNYVSKWGIWMKDMNFPIDVLWFTDDLKVGYIVENMLPSSYPTAYMPNADMRYVLEVPAGTVKSYGIAVGQNVVIK